MCFCALLSADCAMCTKPNQTKPSQVAGTGPPMCCLYNCTPLQSQHSTSPPADDWGPEKSWSICSKQWTWIHLTFNICFALKQLVSTELGFFWCTQLQLAVKSDFFFVPVCDACLMTCLNLLISWSYLNLPLPHGLLSTYLQYLHTLPTRLMTN